LGDEWLGLALRVKSLVEELRSVVKYYRDVKAIARRMFVTNSFDGILAAIGVDVGGFSSNVDPALIAMGIIGGGVAMGVFSGVVGVYLSERAERLKEVSELERKMAKSLKGTVYWKAAKIVPLYVALWSGLGVLIFPTLIASPYILANMGLIGVKTAFLASIALALTLMTLLGLYLGAISGEGLVKPALRAFSVGLGGALLVWVLRTILGIPIA
jgi:predicted membrane protein (TIGR00267 family)